MKKLSVAPCARFLLPCALSAAVGAAWAQAPAATAAAAVPTVVVTASGAPVDIKDAPASISVITREEIERQPVYDLNTLLRRIPGVTGGTSATGEQSKIKLRGLPEKYTLILVDGKRQGSSTDTAYRPDQSRQDLNWITPDMIERIEVVRGPMSSLYGSDAMGGVINIITRKVPRQWGGSATLNYTAAEESGRGDAHQASVNLAGPLSQAVGIRLGASKKRQVADSVSTGNRAFGGVGGERNDNFTGQLNWKIAERQSMSVDVAYGKQQASGGGGLGATGVPVIEAFGASELTRKSAGIGHEGRWGFGKTKVNLYHNAYDSKISGHTAKSKDTLLDATLEKPFKFGVDHLLTLGGQWKDEELTNTRTIGTVPTDYLGNVASGSTLSVTTAAVFAEDQNFLREDLTATVGARLDHHEKFGNNTSPRLYLVYRPAEAWTVRGGISKGFRAPSLKENAPNAVTSSRGNGCAGLRPFGYVTGTCYMAGNPDLKPETSTSAELGVAFERAGWDAGLTFFHTDFKNKIDYAPLGFYQGLWWTMMENIQKARTRGLEGTLAIPLARSLTLRNNLTYMIEAKNLSTGASLLNTPKVSLFSALGWQANDKVYAELSAQHTGKQLGGGSIYTKKYTITDATVSYRMNDKLTVRGGVQNLFEEGPETVGVADNYVQGRRFFAGLTARF